MRQIEQQIVSLFVAPHRRERIDFLLSKPSKRTKGLWEFHESSIFEQRCLIEIPGADQNDSRILELMRSMGAKTECYAISMLKSLDGQLLSLESALLEAVGSTMETVLFCPESAVGYYEGGHAKNRYLLCRPKHAA
jgi:hypothetical protein